MTNSFEDIANELHLEDEKISEIYKEWQLLKKEIKFDDSQKDSIKLCRLRKIEYDIDNYFEDRGSDISDKFEWTQSWSPLTKEEKRKLQENQGGRPKDTHLEETKARLRKRYYHLKNNIGYSKKKCLEVLHNDEFPQWSISTIETHLKR